MENSYGIGVRNRYELFYDNESDPLDMIKKKSDSKKKDRNAEKENRSKLEKTKEPAKKTEQPPKQIEKTTVEENNKELPKDQHEASPKQTTQIETKVKFADREEQNNRRNKVDGGEKEFRSGPPTGQRVDAESRGRGGFGGAEFPRGGRGGGMRRGRGEFRGKREYDRQSGMVTSGVKAFDKKEGAGSFNWGSDKDHIDDSLPSEDADESSSKATTDKPTQSAEGTTPENNEVDSPSKEEEEPKEMTLDEWKASQKRDKPQFNIRRAGEGENDSQWKETFVLKKKGGSSKKVKSVDVEMEDVADVDVQHGKRKVLLPIDFQFSDTPSRGRFRGRGRGGPGAPRGRGGRGARGGAGRFPASNRQEAPKMDNERDFPSLG